MIRKVLGGVLVLVVASLIGFWILPAADLPERNTSYIDMHVHVGCIGEGASGCFVSPSLRESYKFPFYLRAFDTSVEELHEHGDAVVLEKLSRKIRESKRVGYAVVLAMDGVIDRQSGELDFERTQVYVPTDYLIGGLAKYDNLLLGASVNPYRRDWAERLVHAKTNGAVLIKWIPAIMDIEPDDPALEGYYRKLVELDLPLLSHAGQERSFAHANDALGDPLRLELALKLGVTVIAAHIATTGRSQGQDNFERLLPLFERYPNLYAEISSLTQINKLGYLKDALQKPRVVERLLYGTDYPLQFFPLVSPWYQINNVSPSVLKSIQRIDHQWDRDVALKEAMGVPESVFTRSQLLLK